MFAYCFNNPVSMSDDTGNWPQWIKDVGRIVGDFFATLGKALANSCSITTEFGAGLGVKRTINGLSIEATGIFAADQTKTYINGEKETTRKTSLTIQAQAFDNVDLGLEVERSAPIEDARRHGTIGAKKGTTSVVLGAFVNNWGIGYNTKPKANWEISFGFAAYLLFGGGIEFSFDLNRFIEVW